MRYWITVGIMLIGMTANTSAANVTFYISPSGNDAWSGKLAEVNGQKTDGALATLTRARDLVREARRAGGGPAPAGIDVVLRGGIYFLTEPLVLETADSGSAACPIRWMAFAGESPVISGGQKIENWENGTLNGHSVWVARLGAAAQGKGCFRELWVNGRRRQRARWPKKNNNYLGVAQVIPEAGSSTYKGGHAFGFGANELKAWPGATAGEVIVFNRWVESRLPIKAIDESNHRAEFTKAAVFELAGGDPYFVENVPETLSEPGEWCLDLSGTLYYLPMPGEDPAQTQVIVPRLTQVLGLEADTGRGQLLEHLNFVGLTFAHSEWYYDREQHDAENLARQSGFNQAAHGVAAVVEAHGSRHCLFDHCTIEHAGNYAIDLGRGCQEDRILNCTCTDLGAGGIKIGDTELHGDSQLANFGNEVSDCVISNAGHLFASAVGILIGQSHDNRIVHNDIHGLYYTGISIGWTWGYGPAESGGNLVEANHVHHIGTHADGEAPVLSDMGGIYTLGGEKGTIIRLNRFHDIAGLRYGGWGIYFDEGTTGIVAEKNLVYNTTHGGFHQHYGKENIVRNNIFALGRDAQIQRTRIEDHVSFRFEHNIVWYQTGALLSGDWSTLRVGLDGNTYWREGGGDIRFANLSWPQWQALGEDAHSHILNPNFIDPHGCDFGFRAGPPAEFEPFDVSIAGPRGLSTAVK